MTDTTSKHFDPVQARQVSRKLREYAVSASDNDKMRDAADLLDRACDRIAQLEQRIHEYLATGANRELSERIAQLEQELAQVGAELDAELDER